MSSESSSFGSSGVYVGTDWQVRCSTYPASTPILTIDAGRSAMSVSVTPMKQMSDEAVAFARELARQAALFAAECERLHGAELERLADASEADASEAAGGPAAA
jgi:hypothetical protein